MGDNFPGRPPGSKANPLRAVDFSIANESNYAIRNIRIFILYKKRGQVISYSGAVLKKQILPKLALQFTHAHRVEHFLDGAVEVRVLDYEADRSVGTSPVDLLFK